METVIDRIIRGYELRQLLGEGGFGAVYRAYQPAVGREVAVKVILPEFANHPDFIRRFETEAQVVARLEHPFIVPLYDYWREPNGAYLVMRMLRGGSLGQKLEKMTASEMFDAQHAIRLVDQIAGALTVAHRNGVIHRDLKPDNILLDEEGNGYLSDFGIAKVGAGDDEEGEANGITGSPGFISPEQITGGEITPATDVYSFGVIIYEMVTGQHPFNTATTGQMIIKHLQEPLPDCTIFRPDLDPAVNMVIQTATAKDPYERYMDAMSLAQAFRQALSGAQTLEIIFNEDDIQVFNPYKGLRPFEESDSMDFFGRDTLIQQLIERMSEPRPEARFLAVVGPSGSGKSSVVKAGLIPMIRSGALPNSRDWFVVEMVPGTDPLRQLEAALLSVAIDPPSNIYERLKQNPQSLYEITRETLEEIDGELLLVIDQFEEVFTLSDDEETRTHFIRMLHHAVLTAGTRLRVIVTLRADFYDKPLLYENFATLMQSRTQVVVPLTAEEIERTIVGPAERANLIVNQDLVLAVISEVVEEPGALPLLQYALTEVYERRDGRRLTLEAYQQSGGVLGALARRAEEVYQQLPNKEKAIARQIFLRLVTLGEGSEDTRRRVRRVELTALGKDGMIDHVIDGFGRFRLLTFDVETGTREPMVEVAHEALIREWGRLREWLDRSRADVRLQRVLLAAQGEWEKSGRDRSYLLNGARLAQYTEWARTTDISLTPEEQSYLKASIGERKRQQKLEEARSAREQSLASRSRNVLRVLVAVMVVATCGALSLSGFAFSQSQQAQEARAAAQSEADSRATQQEIAIANASTAVAAQDLMRLEADARETQQQLALDSAATAVSAQGVAQLRADEAATQAQNALDSAATATIAQGAAQDEADSAATQAQNALNSGATATYAQGEAQFEAGNAQTQAAMAATSAADAQIQADNAETQAANAEEQSLQRATQQRLAEQNATLSAGNAATAAAAATQSALNANAASANEATANARATQAFISAQQANQQSTQAYLNAQQANQQSTQAAISANQAATAAANAANQAATAVAAQATSAYQQTQAEALALAASSGQALANGDRGLGKHLALLAINHSMEAAALTAADDYVAARVFSNLVDNAYSAGPRVLMTQLTYQFSEVEYVRSIDGAWIYLRCGDTSSTQPDGSANCWLYTTDAASGVPYPLINIGHLTSPYRNDMARWVELAVDSTGHYVFVSGQDDRISMFNLRSGTLVRQFIGHSNRINDIKLSHDDSRLISTSQDGTTRIWDVSTGTQIENFNVGPALSADLSQDNGRFVVGLGNTIQLRNADTGAMIMTLPSNDNNAFEDVLFSPDGRVVAATSNKAQVYLWNAQTNYTFISALRGHNYRVTDISFSSNSTQLASVDEGGGINIWDTSAGYRGDRSVAVAEFESASHLTSVAFSLDGPVIATIGADGPAEIWDTELSTDYIRDLSSVPSGNGAVVTYDSAGSKFFLLYCHNWNADAQACNEYRGRMKILGGLEVGADFPLPAEMAGIRLSYGGANSDLSRIYLLGQGHLYVINHSGQLVQHVADFYNAAESPTGITLSTDGTRLLAALSDGIWVWNAQTAALISRLPQSSGAQGVQLNAAGSRIYSIIGTHVRIWNMADFTVRRNVEVLVDSGFGMFSTFTLSPDGQYAFISNFYNGQSIWNLRTGTKVSELASVSPNGGFSSSILAPQFTHDSGYLMAAYCGSPCETYRLNFYESSTGQLVRSLEQTLEVSNLPIADLETAMAIRADDRRMISVSTNGRVREWHVPNIAFLSTQICNNGYVRGLTAEESNAYDVDHQSSCAHVMGDFLNINMVNLFPEDPNAVGLASFPTETALPPTITPTAAPTAQTLPVFASMDDGAPDWTASSGWALSADARVGESGQGWLSLPEAGTHTLTWNTPLDLTGTQRPELVFVSTLHSAASTPLIEASLDGTSWFPLAGVPSGDMVLVHVDLSAFSGGTLWLRWVWTWQSPVNAETVSDYWSFDSVFVAEAPEPTAVPTATETETPAATLEPGLTPTDVPLPTATLEQPTDVPTVEPPAETEVPTEPPTVEPTAEPPTIEPPTPEPQPTEPVTDLQSVAEPAPEETAAS